MSIVKFLGDRPFGGQMSARQTFEGLYESPTSRGPVTLRIKYMTAHNP